MRRAAFSRFFLTFFDFFPLLYCLYVLLYCYTFVTIDNHSSLINRYHIVTFHCMYVCTHCIIALCACMHSLHHCTVCISALCAYVHSMYVCVCIYPHMMTVPHACIYAYVHMTIAHVRSSLCRTYIRLSRLLCIAQPCYISWYNHALCAYLRSIRPLPLPSYQSMRVRPLASIPCLPAMHLLVAVFPYLPPIARQCPSHVRDTQCYPESNTCTPPNWG